jgi:hypothetical protein
VSADGSVSRETRTAPGIRICSKCKKEHTRKHYYCADCHAAYMREWRKDHPLTGDARARDIARSKASVYLRRGYLKRKPCEECGERAEMHHWHGYDDALDVQWLCRKHHLAVHATA